MKDLKTIIFLMLAIVGVGILYRYLSLNEAGYPTTDPLPSSSESEIGRLLSDLEEETQIKFNQTDPADFAWPGRENVVRQEAFVSNPVEEGLFLKVESFLKNRSFETRLIKNDLTGYQKDNLVCLLEKTPKDNFGQLTITVTCGEISEEK